jgi:hypothetical protein
MKQTIAAILFSILVLCASRGLAWTPNTQEQQVGQLLSTGSGQQRPGVFFDPILGQVARERAADMAVRNYFAHINPDGVAANYLVSQAGYHFPDWWAPYLSGTYNFIESLGAGYSTASGVWAAWMNSPAHRTHLLALDPGHFYAQETHYGVGYVDVPGSAYEHYWVVITAPGVCPLSPRDGAQVTNDAIAVSGTNPSGLPVATVYAQIENLSGTSTPLLASGTSSWSVNLTGLVPGSNLIRVQAKDLSDTVISEASLNLLLVAYRPLVVSISGSGSITPGFSGTTSRQVGLGYQISATPAASYLFGGWSGGITSGSSALSFFMQEGLALQANFVPNPFPTSKGTFSGLMQSGTDGMLNLTLNPTGKFSGKIYLGAVAYSYTGKFDALGQADVQVKRTGTTPIALHLALDTSSHNQISGTATVGAITSSFTADRAIFNSRTNPTPLVGSYTLVMKPSASGTAPPLPTGAGIATLRINASGAATFSGQLPDSTKFTCSSSLTPDSRLALFAVLPGHRGLLNGPLAFANLPGSDATGSIHWIKAPLATDPAFPLGFDLSLDATLCAYASPTSPATTFNLNLLDNLGTPLFSTSVPFTPLGKFQFPIPAPLKFTLSGNKQTGAITGSFTHPNSAAKCAVRAVFLQKQGSAFGFFAGGSSTGAFQLTP